MTETRPYYSTRQIIDVDSFLEERDTYYLMCLSKAQLHALRIMAKTRLLWPTTWAKERYEQSYLLPDATDWDAIDAHISEFISESERVEMCNNAMLDALQDIASSIRLSSCCGASVTGGQEIDGEFYYGQETPLSEPIAFGAGEEFETEGAYESHKCEIANGIINGLIGSLNGISLISLAGLLASSVLAAIVGFGLIFAPPVAVILAVLASGLTFAFFGLLADEIDDNKEILVCLLYSASDAVEAYDNLKQAIEDLSIDLGAIEIQVGPLLDLVMQMSPIDTMNALFENVGLPTIPGSTIECETACGQQCPEWLYFYGAGDALVLGQSLTATSEYDSGVGHHRLLVATNVTDCTCDNLTFEITGITGAYGGVSAGSVKNCASTNLWTYANGYTALLDEYCGRALDIRGTGSFSLTFILSDTTC